MGDREKKISILKLDVEGFEFEIIPQILKDGFYDLIEQFTLEVHSDGQHERNLEDMTYMLNNLQSLYLKGLRIMNYDPNLTIERMFSNSQNYFSNFDITLIRNT